VAENVVTKAELVAAVAKATGVPKTKAEGFINAFLNTVIKSLKAKKQVRLVGFGTFKVAKRKARKVKNPQDPSKIITVKAANVVKFKAGKDIKIV